MTDPARRPTDLVVSPTGLSFAGRPFPCTNGRADLWSGDPKDPFYNLMVRVPHAFSHERLRRADPLYDLVILTDWNWPQAEAGHGSAIFIHTWRKPGHPTEGCVGLRRRDLLWIAPRIRYETRLVVL